jgi:glycosyltransferase involved in cell wall biosynthesis
VAFHIVVPRRSNLAEQTQLAKNDQSPRHAVVCMADRLNARVHEPVATMAAPSLKDRILPTAELWALAEAVARAATSSDTIFCASEAAGLQLAATYKGRSSRPRLALFAHNLDRPRARFAMRWWTMARTVDLFLACSEYQIEFLRRYLRLSEDRVRFIWDHTDDRFFTPGPARAKSRPLIVSVGLEQRDYTTLALATADLDVDVRISGFSQDARKGSLPDPLPANMERRFYSWLDLRQLYRDADVVVVSCHENSYAAGVQSLMEASCCRRPIIATATKGLRSYIGDVMAAVRPGNATEMRQAITGVLRDPAATEARVAKSYEVARRTFAMDRYVDEICRSLEALASAER